MEGAPVGEIHRPLFFPLFVDGLLILSLDGPFRSSEEGEQEQESPRHQA